MTEPRWLTPTEHEAWIRFSAVLELLPASLDSQLARDEGLTHFDYFTLAMLSEAPDHVLRASALAARTNATLPRLSKVIGRLATQGLVTKEPCPDDKRATDIRLTDDGWKRVVRAAPGHVENVRATVLDALTPAEVEQLSTISAALLTRLDPEGKMLASR
jgi:DNA-binding MarR family transcriptional regulator